MPRMPAEWEPQRSVWLQWPHDAHFEHYPRKLDGTWVAMVAALQTGGGGVDILVRDARQEAHVAGLLKYYGLEAPGTRLHTVPFDDVWVRDNGPSFVEGDDGALKAVHWRFSQWGHKYDYPYDKDAEVPARIADVLGIEVIRSDLTTEGGAIEINGKGSFIGTRSSILNPNRNPNWSTEQVEAELARCLGISNFIWLSGAPPETCIALGDGTDFHVDLCARFVGPSTVLYAWDETGEDPRHPYLARHLEELKAARDEAGRPLTLVPLPLPKNGVYAIGEEQVSPLQNGFTDASYANFLIADKAVLVPVFGNANDARAKAIIAEHFPDREVVGIQATLINEDGGAMHCTTQQEPALAD